MNKPKPRNPLVNNPMFVEHAKHRTKLAANGNKLAAQYFVSLAALTVLVILLLLGSDSILIQVLFAGVVLLIPWHHSAAIIFFLVQASLFIHEGPTGLSKVNYNPIIVSVVTLLFISCADRFRTSWRMLGDGSLNSLWTSILGLGEHSLGNNLDHQANECSAASMIRRLIRIAGAAVLAVFVASGVMILFPERIDSASEIRLGSLELKAISLAVVVLLTGVIASHILSTIFWRSLTTTQARLYLRSIANQWLRPEARAIALRKIKQRKTDKNITT